MDSVVLVRAGEGCLLDVDPGFGAGVGGEDWEEARRALRGVLVSAPAGRWRAPPPAGPNDALLGLVIVSGMVCREGRLRDRHLLELLGPGDVLQLPARVEGSRLSSETVLTCALDTQMLALGQPFIRAAARWPGVLVAVQQRLEIQRERLAVQALITHLARAEHRLLLMLWHLADRWGTVTPKGTVLSLPLSHELLAQLVAARRPTATLALKMLEDEQQVKRLPNGSWLLPPPAEHAVQTITMTSPTAQVQGEVLASRLRPSWAAEHARALRAEAKLARAGRARATRSPQARP